MTLRGGGGHLVHRVGMWFSNFLPLRIIFVKNILSVGYQNNQINIIKNFMT